MILIKSHIRRLSLFSLLFAVVASAAVDQTITMTLERKADLAINVGSVNLGVIQGIAGSQYYEKQNAVRLSFRCNARTNWEVRLSGGNFTSGGNSIPIAQLRWRKASTSYNAMPGSGSYTVVSSSADYPGHGANWHDEDISYRLDLTGDEYEGTYQAILTYTLFVP